MTFRAPSTARAVRCPSCGGPLDSAGRRCTVCGGIVQIETVAFEARRSAGRLADDLLQKARTFDSGRILWIFALTPLLIGPPLIAVGLSWFGYSKGSSRQEWLILFALANILLSALFWLQAGEYAAGIVRDSLDWLHWSTRDGSIEPALRV